MSKKYEVRVNIGEGGFSYYTNYLFNAIRAMWYYHKVYYKDEDFRFVEIIMR